jgi:hypothetical protein
MPCAPGARCRFPHSSARMSALLCTPAPHTTRGAGLGFRAREGGASGRVPDARGTAKAGLALPAAQSRVARHASQRSCVRSPS